MKSRGRAHSPSTPRVVMAPIQLSSIKKAHIVLVLSLLLNVLSGSDAFTAAHELPLCPPTAAAPAAPAAVEPAEGAAAL